MSSSSILPGGNGTPPGISDVIGQDDLTRWAQIAGVLKYLTAPLDPPPAPTTSLPMATGLMASVFTNMYAGLRTAGVAHESSIQQSAGWAAFLGQIGDIAAFIVQLLALLLAPVGQVVLEGLGTLRKGIDPAVGILAQEVLSEFLGAEVANLGMPLGISTGDHIARANAVGALLYNQLESEFAPANGVLVPTSAPAETFSGLAVNFGLASGIFGLIGGCIPGGFHVNELRELGEEVATNIGLGRLVRRALTPLVQILVAQPATWAINTKYLPTQFKEADLVNPYAAAVMPHDQIFKAMNLLGYSNDKIQAFIQLHQKKLTPHDVKILMDNGFWDATTGQDYISKLGWPTELVPTVMLLEELREDKAWYNKLIDEMETEVKNGRVTIDEFTQVLNGLPYSQVVKDTIVATVNYKVKAHVAHAPHALSEGELVQGFEAGLLTATDLTDRWTKLGLSDQDQTVRMSLLLLRLNRMEKTVEAKQAHYQQQLVVFQQKLAGQKPGPQPPAPPVPPFPLS
jgi:hypothetical protein